MSLPSRFGLKTGRTQTGGASSSRVLNKVSVSQHVSQKSPPKKKDLEKRKFKDQNSEPSTRLRTVDSASEFPFEAPVTVAGDWFAEMADAYLGPSKFINW